MKVLTKNGTKNGIKIVDIEGEIDVYTSMELKKELNGMIDNGVKKIIINLEKVNYMDSSGLGILVAILKRLKQEDGIMKLTKMNIGIKKIFEITKLTKFFEIYEDDETALKSF